MIPGLPNLSGLPTVILPVLLIILCIFGVAIIAGLGVRVQRTGQQQAAAERGIRTLRSCHLCGGALEPCSLSTYRGMVVLRRGGRTRMVGAVCCTQCGHVDLFAAQD